MILEGQNTPRILVMLSQLLHPYLDTKLLDGCFDLPFINTAVIPVILSAPAIVLAFSPNSTKNIAVFSFAPIHLACFCFFSWPYLSVGRVKSTNSAVSPFFCLSWFSLCSSESRNWTIHLKAFLSRYSRNRLMSV